MMLNDRKNISKKLGMGIAGGEKGFIFAPALGKRRAGLRGEQGRKKVSKKLARELAERKKRLPLQPGSEESGED